MMAKVRERASGMLQNRATWPHRLAGWVAGLVGITLLAQLVQQVWWTDSPVPFWRGAAQVVLIVLCLSVYLRTSGAQVILAGNKDPDFFHPEKLNDAARWAAGGFGLLTGVLAFFGIKEGALDDLLRTRPTSALFVFAMVGAGLLGGLLAPAFAPERRIHLIPVLFVILTLALFSYLVFPKIAEPGLAKIANAMAVTGAALLLLLIIVGRRATISLIAAVLVIGMAATSMGLYGAAKISVLSKAFTAAPNISARLGAADGRDVLAITVVQTRREQRSRLTVSAVAQRSASDTATSVVGQARLAPDATGLINAALAFPLRASRWAYISVRACDAAECGAHDEVVRLSGALAVPDQIGGALSYDVGNERVQVRVTATSLAAGSRVQANVVRVLGPELQQVAAATLVPDAAGSVEWTTSVAPGAVGSRLTLNYRHCDTVTCDQTDKELAAYSLAK